MKKFRSFLFVPFLGVLVACGPTDPWSDPDDVVLVEVDGKQVTLPMLEFMMDERGVTESDQEGMRALLDELIRLRVVASAAEETGLASEKMLRAERAIKDMEALRLAYFKKIYEQYPVTDESIREMYEAQIKRSGDYQYQLQTIVYPNQTSALSALVELSDASNTFETLIERATQLEQTILTIPWVDQSQLPDRLRPELAKAQIGDVLSLPLPAPDGNQWLVAQVTDRRPIDTPTLDEVREGIARTLVRQRLEALVEDLYQDADIVPMLEVGEPRGSAEANK